MSRLRRATAELQAELARGRRPAAPVNTRKPRTSRRPNAELAPHSWTISTWPPGVFPNSPEKARWLIRSHSDELFSAGVLSRVGRDLVVLGARYTRWLEAKASRVHEYRGGAARSKDRLAA